MMYESVKAFDLNMSSYSIKN